MNDSISREAVLGLFATHDGNYLYEAIRDMPPAQPEIIHCKECKHWFDIDDGRQKHRMCADVYGDWFCADAERRTDE